MIINEQSILKALVFMFYDLKIQRLTRILKMLDM